MVIQLRSLALVAVFFRGIRATSSDLDACGGGAGCAAPRPAVDGDGDEAVLLQLVSLQLARGSKGKVSSQAQGSSTNTGGFVCYGKYTACKLDENDDTWTGHGTALKVQSPWFFDQAEIMTIDDCMAYCTRMNANSSIGCYGVEFNHNHGLQEGSTKKGEARCEIWTLPFEVYNPDKSCGHECCTLDIPEFPLARSLRPMGDPPNYGDGTRGCHTEGGDEPFWMVGRTLGPEDYLPKSAPSPEPTATDIFAVAEPEETCVSTCADLDMQCSDDSSVLSTDSDLATAWKELGYDCASFQGPWKNSKTAPFYGGGEGKCFRPRVDSMFCNASQSNPNRRSICRCVAA